MLEMSCRDFASALGAKQSVPAGGSATAYVGALASALGSMVVRFTLGKPKYAAYEENLERLLGQTDLIRERLLELALEDAAALEPLTDAYALARDDPERPRRLEEAAWGACRAPRQMMAAACRLIEILEELREQGSRLLLSDVGCAAALARACLEAAALNVAVNTATLQDRTVAQGYNDDCDELLAAYSPRAQALVESVYAAFRQEEGE